MSNLSILSRLQNHEILVADGATGTNLIDRGLPAGLTQEAWVLERPEQIIQLHREFIDAGANIILTSTFNATPIRMIGSSLEGKVVEVNTKAVELAKSAIGNQPVYLAGSLGPVGQLLKPYGPLEFDEVRAAYTEQARGLNEAGVDFMVIETQYDLGEVRAAIQGIRENTDLPLVVSLSYDRGLRTMMGVKPSQAAKELNALPVEIIGVNCGHSLQENLQNLVELRQATDKPIWFKPNAGLPHLDSTGKTVYDVAAQEMGALVPAWISAGAQIVGGCCGTTPQHLAEIASQVSHQKTKS